VLAGLSCMRAHPPHNAYVVAKDGELAMASAKDRFNVLLTLAKLAELGYLTVELTTIGVMPVRVFVLKDRIVGHDYHASLREFTKLYAEWLSDV
jgi:hypothetical protein